MAGVAITGSSPAHAVTRDWEITSLDGCQPLHALGWKSHIWQGKLAKNGRKHQQTEANIEREREAQS